MSVDKHNKGVAEEKHAGGRPRKYKSPKEMQVAIDKYFKDNKKPTICGLALDLGFISRNSLLSYEDYSKEFFGTIKVAKLKVENGYEQELRSNHVAGAIFALKNFDWSDKRDLAVTGDLNINVINYAKSGDSNGDDNPTAPLPAS